MRLKPLAYLENFKPVPLLLVIVSPRHRLRGLLRRQVLKRALTCISNKSESNQTFKPSMPRYWLAYTPGHEAKGPFRLGRHR
jgi:hypothetical protein